MQPEVELFTTYLKILTEEPDWSSRALRIDRAVKHFVYKTNEGARQQRTEIFKAAQNMARTLADPKPAMKVMTEQKDLMDQQCARIVKQEVLINELQAKIDQMESNWYSPAHMKAMKDCVKCAQLRAKVEEQAAENLVLKGRLTSQSMAKDLMIFKDERIADLRAKTDELSDKIGRLEHNVAVERSSLVEWDETFNLIARLISTRAVTELDKELAKPTTTGEK